MKLVATLLLVLCLAGFSLCSPPASPSASQTFASIRTLCFDGPNATEEHPVFDCFKNAPSVQEVYNYMENDTWLTENPFLLCAFLESIVYCANQFPDLSTYEECIGQVQGVCTAETSGTGSLAGVCPNANCTYGMDPSTYDQSATFTELLGVCNFMGSGSANVKALWLVTVGVASDGTVDFDEIDDNENACTFYQQFLYVANASFTYANTTQNGTLKGAAEECLGAARQGCQAAVYYMGVADPEDCVSPNCQTGMEPVATTTTATTTESANTPNTEITTSSHAPATTKKSNAFRVDASVVYVLLAIFALLM